MCLHVIVHAENKVSFGVVECRHQRIVLAEIAQQVDALDILILLTELLDLPIRIVFREPSFTRTNSQSYPSIFLNSSITISTTFRIVASEL